MFEAWTNVQIKIVFKNYLILLSIDWLTDIDWWKQGSWFVIQLNITFQQNKFN